MVRLRQIIKRSVDIACSSAGLIVLAPVLAGTACAVRLKLGSPVIFKQERPGLHGQPFQIMKFRTMTAEKGSDGNLLPDDKRLTSFGLFLRASSLDELPELINVLKGEMSLVGPRPLRMSYLEHYSTEQARRHDARPGITGWSQINGRNSLTWEEKFALDVWYVDNQSFWLDIKILMQTLAKVLVREGISHDGHATMFKFTGSPSNTSAGQADISIV